MLTFIHLQSHTMNNKSVTAEQIFHKDEKQIKLILFLAYHVNLSSKEIVPLQKGVGMNTKINENIKVKKYLAKAVHKLQRLFDHFKY
jgi:hypothetical protein